MTQTIAIDQYGQRYLNLGKYPRKALCERLGRKHVSKMYCDDGNGKSNHVGYVIGGHWLTLYNVTPWIGKCAA
jgi:hypothetical protein